MSILFELDTRNRQKAGGDVINCLWVFLLSWELYLWTFCFVHIKCSYLSAFSVSSFFLCTLVILTLQEFFLATFTATVINRIWNYGPHTLKETQNDHWQCSHVLCGHFASLLSSFHAFWIELKLMTFTFCGCFLCIISLFICLILVTFYNFEFFRG